MEGKKGKRESPEGLLPCFISDEALKIEQLHSAARMSRFPAAQRSCWQPKSQVSKAENFFHVETKKKRPDRKSDGAERRTSPPAPPSGHGEAFGKEGIFSAQATAIRFQRLEEMKQLVQRETHSQVSSVEAMEPVVAFTLLLTCCRAGPG